MKKTTLDELLAKANAGAVRRSQSDEEHRTQATCVRWFRLKYPHLFARLFAVPNGGRRDGLTGARLKAEGVIPGVSDLILLKRNRHYCGLLIEMKTANGRQSDAQKWWQQEVCADGEFKYVLCRGIDDFMREVDGYLSECE